MAGPEGDGGWRRTRRICAREDVAFTSAAGDVEGEGEREQCELVRNITRHTFLSISLNLVDWVGLCSAATKAAIDDWSVVVVERARSFDRYTIDTAQTLTSRAPTRCSRRALRVET